MADRSFLDWPFFEPRHRQLADAVEEWCTSHLHVDNGFITERLYRAVRGLRIYEGATDVQKVIIARAALAAARS